MEIKEIFLERKKTIDTALKLYRSVLDDLSSKEKIFAELAAKAARQDAEKSFQEQHKEVLESTKELLKNAEIERALLRCPDEKLHRQPEDRYYYCELCGFVWDDTPPKHF